MGRVLLITNPAAARTDPAVVRTVSTVLGREGWDVDVVGTTRPGHAAELAGRTWSRSMRATGPRCRR